MSPTLRDVLLIAVGGAAGAVLRHLVGRAVGAQQGPSFPWHTFVINVTGAFAIGLLLVLASRLGFPAWWRPLLAVGVLGGYTTFSTFSLETVELAMQGRVGLSIAYALGSVSTTVIACWCGIAVGRGVT